MCFLKGYFSFSLLLLALLFTQSCTDPPPLVVGPVKAELSAPMDSIRAKLVLTAVKPNGEEEDLSAVLWAVPQFRYRLEVSGPMGISLASLIWQPDRWLLNLPSQERHSLGVSDVVRVPSAPIPPFSVHHLFGPVWGQVLPNGSEQAQTWVSQGRRVMAWNDPHGRPIRAELDTVKNFPLHVVIPGTSPAEELRVEYGDPVVMDSLVVPSKAVFFHGGRKVFAVRLKELRRTLTWGKAIWTMKPLGPPL